MASWKSRAGSGAPRLRRYGMPVGVAAALTLVVAAAFWAGHEPAERIGYGRFRKALAEGRVASVRVGTSTITGTLRNAGGLVPFRVSRVGLESDVELPALLERHVPDADYDADEGMTATASTVLPLLAVLLIGGAAAAMLIARGGFGSAPAFAKSRHKTYDAAKFRVTFDDVAGCDEAVAELREVVDYLSTPERFNALGGRIPKGILLVGPPGTGKTLLAKAVAGEAGVPFFALSGSDFMEMYVGVGAARVRSLFAQAEAQAPCLIFIDEIDAIGKARGAGGSPAGEERDQTLNQLLVAMDGFDPARGVIVMAATNRPETLDAALVRPGRFDRNVTVDRPDVGGRERILQVHLRNVPTADEIDVRTIAAMTPGFVGADLANLVNEAALLAARKGKMIVERGDFEEGVERLMAGPQKRQRVVRKEELRRVAVHEAGHALVSRSLPETDAVHKVTIVGRGSAALGYTMYRPEDDRFLHTQTWLRNRMCGLLGGTIAEELVYGDFSDGATSDLQRVTDIARRMVTDFGMSPRIGRVSYQADGRGAFLPGGNPSAPPCSEATAREIELEVRRLIDEAVELTRAILLDRRAALDEVTELLVERETIDAETLEGVLERHPLTARAG